MTLRTYTDFAEAKALAEQTEKRVGGTFREDGTPVYFLHDPDLSDDEGRELGFELGKDVIVDVTAKVKEMEQRGYTFDAADASFELLLAEQVEGVRPSYFSVESWRVITDSAPDAEAGSELRVSAQMAGGAGEANQGAVAARLGVDALRIRRRHVGQYLDLGLDQAE